MIIRFDETMEGLIAFQRHHYATSPSQQKSRRTQSILFPAILFTVFTVSAVLQESPLMFIVGAAAALMIFFSMRGKIDAMHLDAVEKQTREMFSEGENKVVFGPRELEVTPEFLVKRSPVHEFIVRWSAVERIVETLDYGYIYWCGVAAHQIPKKQVSKDEYRAFMEAAKSAWEAAKATKSQTAASSLPLPPDS